MNDVDNTVFEGVEILREEGRVLGLCPNGIVFPLCRVSREYCKRIAGMKGLPAQKAREALTIARQFQEWKRNKGW